MVGELATIRLHILIDLHAAIVTSVFNVIVVRMFEVVQGPVWLHLVADLYFWNVHLDLVFKFSVVARLVMRHVSTQCITAKRVRVVVLLIVV